jgi:hypothetical protein
MTAPLIRTLFAEEIDRRIEEVIKIDQTDDTILREELDEYVVTSAIRSHFTGICESYLATPNKPHEGIAVWVSGFFGSGKSSFAKFLGLALSNHPVVGESASVRLAKRAGDQRLQVVLKQINERIPTHAVIFDVSTDRGIRTGNQTLTEIMYGLFLHSLGYARDLDLSELEIALEEDGRLARFEAEYTRLFDKDWNKEKGKVVFALSEASRVLHSLEPATWPMADSWVRAVRGKADVTTAKLGQRATELMRRRQPGKNLLFVVDEVGQFVARDIQKMLDLQGVVKALAMSGRGKHWLVVTSQEQLGELVSGLDDKRPELARLMDRFPSQIHLEPSDISEVTSKRVLSKNAAAQDALGKLFDAHRGRLADNTLLKADIKLPALTRDAFVDLYPLLPYQIDLIIQVVSGLRTQGGAGKHVGGANRTIIKLAQQLLINPAVNLAGQPIGALARLDQIYDLVEGNIGSDIRSKISALPRRVDHPMAQPVAKVICLLQYVKSVHRTAENIAAALHPSVTADSQLAAVREALRLLEAAHEVRLGDDGYRIPTPAEDGWEQIRSSLRPRPGDSHRLQSEVLAGFWQPQPSQTLCETKAFKAGLAIHGREVEPGDMLFDMHFAEEGKAFSDLAAELRRRSQQERKCVFWAVALNDAIDQRTVELHRSREMLSRKEREARTADEATLIAEEKIRARRHLDELRGLLKAACLAGSVYFRGNDRSPGDRAADVGRAASEILGPVLLDIFDRFKDAAARASDLKKGCDTLLTADSLAGLPAVFSALGLLRSEHGRAVFETETGPLQEVLNRITERANYGESPSGRFLADELAKEPFGWDFEAVRLFVLCLLRAGKIDATSKGQTIDSATSVEARETFTTNNLFRQASFRPPKQAISFQELTKAAEAYRDTFGDEVREINQATITAAIRQQVDRHQDRIADALGQLRSEGLPGCAMLSTALDQMKALVRGSEDNAVAAFNASHRALKDAIKRAADLAQALTGPRLADLARAKRAASICMPFLRQERDLAEAIRTAGATLDDLLARETFFRDLPAIEQHATAITAEYERRYQEALAARCAAYEKAFSRLIATAGWKEIDEDDQRRIADPLERGRVSPTEPVPIPQLRSEREACTSRLRDAVAEIHRLLEGERMATVSIGSYFGDGIETEEQLDAALTGIRDECARLIGSGKKVIVQ